jgi:hypothetical protein
MLHPQINAHKESLPFLMSKKWEAVHWWSGLFHFVCCGFEGFAMRSKRLDWIDIAKGIAIILVIVGHTVPNPSPLRHAIFSFHMPVFFILAGYTFRPKRWCERSADRQALPSLPFMRLTGLSLGRRCRCF